MSEKLQDLHERVQDLEDDLAVTRLTAWLAVIVLAGHVEAVAVAGGARRSVFRSIRDGLQLILAESEPDMRDSVRGERLKNRISELCAMLPVDSSEEVLEEIRRGVWRAERHSSDGAGDI